MQKDPGHYDQENHINTSWDFIGLQLESAYDISNYVLTDKGP